MDKKIAGLLGAAAALTAANSAQAATQVAATELQPDRILQRPLGAGSKCARPP